MADGGPIKPRCARTSDDRRGHRVCDSSPPDPSGEIQRVSSPVRGGIVELGASAEMTASLPVTL